MRWPALAPPADDERGAVEVVPILLITTALASLLVVHAVRVVDTRGRLGGSAREAARHFVESDLGPEASVAARSAATAGLGPMDVDLTRVPGPVVRCRPVTFVARADVAALAGPWGTTVGTAVRVTHSEVVDPYRSGPAGEADCG